MVSDKTFKVAVIALLILILGALVGSFIPESYSDFAFGEDNDFLEFESDLVLFEDDLLYYHFETYSLASFSEELGEDFSSVDKLIDFAKLQEYEIEFDDEILEIYFESCFEENDELICEYSEIVYLVEDDLLEYVVEGFLDE